MEPHKGDTFDFTTFRRVPIKINVTVLPFPLHSPALNSLKIDRPALSDFRFYLHTYYFYRHALRLWLFNGDIFMSSGIAFVVSTIATNSIRRANTGVLCVRPTRVVALSDVVVFIFPFSNIIDEKRIKSHLNYLFYKQAIMFHVLAHNSNDLRISI